MVCLVVLASQKIPPIKGRSKVAVLRLEHEFESLGGLMDPQVAGLHLQAFSFSKSG